ncbi:helix-turn-helix transcriptional regulator [Umezawaea sp. Da 62-37]|uniref:helix-turn-helix domain-containing protein n=1 Tax=Umezawaea sp. Da 62-37 TaxID=3075927 RepID=UPI0028F74E80|nr:helix-turn-helix transcriptional regulator [Umezawaea sp. Da 62-37]WNV85033.1 helix-turn-helix transcriptional regulator [Umezawaea sp. Da 62-37]
MTLPGITPYDGKTLPQSKAVSATNVHEARTALGNRLRELRQLAGQTGKQLAESLSWQPSKVSKIENGKQTPSAEDIKDWTRITNSTSQATALLASLRTLETQHAEWQRILKGGIRPRQNALAELDQKTRLFRVFEATVIPGLLQTSEYARARFAESIRVFKLANDINEAVEARLKRQDIFYRSDKRFHFVLTEAALRFRLCSPEVMLGQLDRLMSLSALPNVKLGIIGFETQYTASPWHGFWLYDDDKVLVETFSAGLNLAQPQEIALYATVFEELASVASYGRSARGIINRVIADLSPDDAEA